MAYLHRCVICGWQRSAASPTVTSPRCENCGCALESVRASDVVAVEAVGPGIHVPERIRSLIMRLAGIVGTAVLMFAAALTGYSAGGPAIAVTAVGVAGLLVVMTMAAEHG